MTSLRTRVLRSFILLLLMTIAPRAIVAQEHRHEPANPSKLGKVTFPVTCAPAVQPTVERGVAMLHSFWFDAAEKTFAEVITQEPNCAMAHWGRSIALMGNPMTRASPSAEALRNGLAAAERAQELSARASHREQMYIDAALAFYRDHATKDHMTRMRALEQEFAKVHATHGEDMEAAIFHARTIVANAPPDDQSYKPLLRAAEIMQPLFDQHPQHPGLAHYLIHAYDVPQLANRATKAAFAYAEIAPDAPHALHMPSHTFTRLGYWDESIATNARSAQAEPVPDAAVHPMDYMVYAYLQQGRAAEAKRVVDRAVQNPDRYYGGLLGYNFAAMPARYALETNAWTDAAALKVPIGAQPYVTALTHFARGIGNARSGKTAAAEAEVEALAKLRDQLKDANDTYWATLVDAQRLAVAAWIAHARSYRTEALELARQAADAEDSVEKHPVTPGPLLPARELYGDLFMELKQPRDALAQYEKTLEREPRRARTLFGAARAAEAAGNRAAAQKHYRELLAVMEKADAGRAEVAAARRYLGTR